MKNDKSGLDSFKLFWEELALPVYIKKRPKRTLKQMSRLRI